MASWSTRRKFSYASLVVLAIILFIAVPFFYFFYKAPTCFDNKKNGDETGVDCGGSCSRLCQSAFLPPRIEWGGAKLEKLADGLYNASAYIVNPNLNGAANDVPYRISLYDKEGVLITERVGKVTLYPRRNSLAFETGIKVSNSIPLKATFEFIAPPVWFSSLDELGGISIVDKKYEDNDTGSSLEVTLENKTLYSYENLNVSVVLYDKDGNVFGFSKTKLDSILPGKKEIAPFTWPINRDGEVVSHEILLNIKPIPRNIK